MSKTCNTCHETKPLDRFGTYLTRVSKEPRVMNRCKDCRNAGIRAERVQPCVDCGLPADAKNTPNDAKRCKPCYAKHRRDYVQAMVNEASSRRRTRQLDLSDDELFMIQEVYSLCRLRSEVTGVPHEVDHIVPLLGEEVCGLHVPHNLQVLTRSANRSKGNRV